VIVYPSGYSEKIYITLRKRDNVREDYDVTLLLVLSKKLVPEDSVMPGTQTLVILKRRKGFVGSFIFLFLINSKLTKYKKYSIFKNIKILVLR